MRRLFWYRLRLLSWFAPRKRSAERPPSPAPRRSSLRHDAFQLEERTTPSIAVAGIAAWESVMSYAGIDVREPVNQPAPVATHPVGLGRVDWNFAGVYVGG